MSRINSLLLANGETVRVSQHEIDSSQFDSIVAAGRRALFTSTKTLGVNLYNAKDAPFCLGSKAYNSAREAGHSASTRKGNYLSSFEVKFNKERNSMELIGGSGQSPTYVRYAVFNGKTFEKPSYESVSSARRACYGSSVVVEIGVRGTAVVSARVV